MIIRSGGPILTDGMVKEFLNSSHIFFCPGGAVSSTIEKHVLFFKELEGTIGSRFLFTYGTIRG